MKRNHLALLLTLVAVALLATSCDTLFTNQFKALGLGQVASDALSNAVTNKDSGAIIAESGISSGTISTSFIDAVTSSPETATAVLAQLQTTADDPAAAPATVEAARVLIVEITLQESGAKTLIDNIVNAVATINFNSFNINSPTDLNSLFAALFPPKAIPAGWTQVEIADIIDQVVSMGANFTDIYDGLVANGKFLNDGVDGAWLAQVDFMVTILKQVTPVPTVELPNRTIGEALAALINDFNTSAPNALHSADYVSVPASIITDVKGNAQLGAIFTAAGMDLTTLLTGFGL